MSLRLAAARAAGIALLLAATTAFAADYPAPMQGVWTATDFKFSTGEFLATVPRGPT